jgi:peptidyl-prolyl cis-trans isomerase D
MLKFFRKHARGWFMIAIIGIIIIVFVLYFGSAGGGRAATVIATVDKRIIADNEFYKEYEKLQDMARMSLGDQLTPEKLKELDLKRKAYDELLNRQIIVAKAADLKIQVSNEELRNSIMSLPLLQTNGTFDERKYQQILRYNRISAEDFEALQRAELTAQKIESFVREGVKISDQEIYDFYATQNQKINVNFVQVSGNDIKKRILPSPQELENYLKNNGNSFLFPEQVKIKYIFFDGDAFSPDISDADIRDYYSSNKESYRTKDGKPLSLSDARNSIVRDLKKTRGLQNAFLEAKKARDVIYQDDNMDAYGSKNNLKVLHVDYFSVNKTPQDFASLKNFKDIILDLQSNELSKVLSSEKGYYLLKIVDKKPAYVPKLNAIENEVRLRFIESEANILAEKEARSILEKMASGEDFDKIVREKGLTIRETGFFQPGNAIPQIGSHKDAAEVLLQLSANKPYSEKPLFINNAYVIFKFKDANKPERKQFEPQKALYEKILLSIKKEQAFKTWLEGNKTAMIKEKRVRIKKQVEDL